MKHFLLLTLFVACLFKNSYSQQKWFVKSGATGSGTSWANAGDFQTIVSNAAAGDSVFVAGGIYKPTGTAIGFSVYNVKMYGGFNGTETNLSQRNLSSGNNSIFQDNGNLSNTDNLFSNFDSPDSVIFDGFTFDAHTGHGTIYNYAISPIINNCKFTSSKTAITNVAGSSPRITNCTFTNNQTGIDNSSHNSSSLSDPIIINCTFTNCIIAIRSLDNSTPFVYNSIFQNNDKGIFISEAEASIMNSIIAGNNNGVYTSGNEGSTTSTPYGSVMLTNCLISGNKQGGCSYADGVYGALINCTIAGNDSTGIYADNSCNITITNSIVSSNAKGIIFKDNRPYAPGIIVYPSPTITYSLVQGYGADATNHNLDGNLDPEFLDAPSYTTAPFVGGNYRTLSNSPTINQGSNSALPSDDTLDLDNKSRIFNKINGGIVDLGAYEFQGTVPTPVTLIKFYGILNNNLAQLYWQTGVEIDFNHFKLEKSLDGKLFNNVVTEINAKGSNSNYSYSLPQTDSIAYYRLKIVDNDGDSAISNIISLQLDNNASLQIYPNPTKQYINLQISKLSQLNIYNASGNIEETFQLQPGINKIDVSKLIPGIYYGKVNGQSFKFIKE